MNSQLLTHAIFVTNDRTVMNQLYEQMIIALYFLFAHNNPPKSLFNGQQSALDYLHLQISIARGCRKIKVTTT
jgi:hypothetical protein